MGGVKIRKIIYIIIAIATCISLSYGAHKQNIKNEIMQIESKIKKNTYDKQYNKAIDIFKNEFSKIKPKDYNIVCEYIIQMTDYIRNTERGLKEVINILTTMEQSKYLSINSKFIVSSKLQSAYLLEQNYAKASRYILNTLILSKKRDDKFNEAKCLVDLGVLFSEIEGESTGIKSIKDGLDIKINDEYKNKFIQVYGNLNIAEIYLKNNEYSNAKKYIEEVEKYSNYIHVNEYYDLNILIYTIKSSIYLSENNSKQAKIYLDKSKELLNNEKLMVGNRKTIYQLATGKYYEAIGDIDKAVYTYKEVLKEDEYEKNKEQDIRYALTRLIKLLEEQKKYDEANLYTDKLLEVIKESEDNRYKDYSYYIIEQASKEYKLEKENNMIKFLFIIILFGSIIFVVIHRYNKNRLISMKHLTLQDKLTNTYNRAYFDSKYEELLDKNIKFSIVMIDIDNFKYINDTYGHQFGDEVLKVITNTIKKLLQEHTYLCRYGGEEFVIISCYKIKEEVLLLAEMIRSSVEGISWSKDIKTTVSIGVAFSNIHYENTLKKSDENMYKAKNTGKNKVVVDNYKK